MKQILILTKMQLGSALDFLKMFGGKDKYKKKNTAPLIIIAGAGILFGFMSGMYSYSYGMSLEMFGITRLLPGIMMAVACIIMLMTSIYKVKGTLFGFGDYDIVMSFPISTSKVVASRLLLLYIINFFFAAVLMIPNYIAYGMLTNPSILFYILAVVSLLFIPLVPIIIASIIGVLIAMASARFKHSNIINILLMILLMCGIMVFTFSVQSDEEFIEMSNNFTKIVDKIYPLTGMYIKGIVDYDIISYLGFILISIAAFVIYAVVIGMVFKKMNTSITSIKTKSNYKFKKQEQSSPFFALLRKEIKRLLSSTIFMMNSCIGVIMMTIGTIALVFVKPETVMQYLEIPGASDVFGALLPFFFSLLTATVYASACSISLEGQNMWIIKSSPIPISTIFKSKIALNLVISMPFILLDSIILGIALKIGFVQWIALIIIPTLYSYMFSIFGLIINLKFPLLNWTNETVVVKQSAASIITMFSGIIFSAIPIACLMLIEGINIELLYICVTAVLIAASLFLQTYLNKRGKKLFMELI